MGNKRKVTVTRKEDSKREKAKDNSENKGAALVKQEPDEETWSTLKISEIKMNTCSIKGIRMYLDAIFEKLYQFFERIQVKGFSDRGTVFVIPAERKLEAAIFEQLAYHLKRTHGMRDLLCQNGYRSYYNTGFEFIQFEKYPRTPIGEIIEDIFKTVERDHFKQVAHKGELVLNLVDRLKTSLENIYQVSNERIKVETNLTGVSIEVLNIEWEDQAKLMADELFKDLQALDKSIYHKVAVLDKRPDNVIIDMVHREVRIPREYNNDFGNPTREDDPKLTDECISILIKNLSERLVENMNDNNDDEEMNIAVLYMINEIQDMDDSEKVEGYERIMNEVYQIINRSVNPEEESEILIAMSMDEFENAYKTSLTTVYGTMPLDVRDSRPADIEKIETIVEDAYDEYMKKWEGLSDSVRACSDTDAEIQLDKGDEDEEDADDDRKDHWAICGKYKTMAVKVGFHKVETRRGNSPEITRVKLFKIALNAVHQKLEILCETGDGENILGITGAVEKLAKTKNQLVSLAENQEGKSQVEVVKESIELIEKIKILESNLAACVEEVLEILSEVEVGTQYLIDKSKEALEKLKDTEDDNLCYATIVEMTLKSVTEYKKLTIGSGLPRVLKIETFRMIKRVARLLVDRCKFKHAFAICTHVSNVKSMWRACLVIRTTLLRYAELKALKISKMRGLKVKYSRSEENNLKQCGLVLDQLIKVNLSVPTSRRQEPDPILVENTSIFEEVEKEIEDEHSRVSTLNKVDPEEMKAHKEQEKKFVRTLSRMLRKHSPKKFISMALSVFVDIPEDFQEITAVNGKERLLSYEVQQGKKLIDVIEEEDENPKKPPTEEIVRTIPTKEQIRSSVEDIKMYQGLKDAERETTIIVIAEVVEKKKGRWEALSKFYKALHQNSYAKQMREPTAMYVEREMSKSRAKYSGEKLYHNCNLGRHSVTVTPFVETGYSCGKNCHPEAEKCLSRNKNFQESTKNSNPHYKKCMLEWSRYGKSSVDMKLLREIFAGFLNFNGRGVTIEETSVINKENGIQHKVLRVIKPCVMLTGENVEEVIDDLEYLSGRPGIVCTHLPEKLGFGDDEWETRPLRIIQNGTLFIPRALGNLVWIVSNARIGVNMVDEKTSTPRSRATNVCILCQKTYQSPVSLLLHLVYQEEVMGNINHICGNHDMCGRFKVCKCRLWRTLTENQYDCEREEFNHYEKKNITQNGNREFNKVSKIQLSNLELLDLSLMPIGQFCDYLILLNQLGIHCYLAGGKFAKRHNLFISTKWSKIAIWGNLYRPIMNIGNNPKYSCLNGENWRSEKFAGYRMSHEGDILMADVRVRARELVEVSENCSTRSNKLGSVGFQPMTARFNPKTEKITYLEDVSPEELEVLKCFLNLDEEIFYENISRYCLTYKSIKDESKDHNRKLCILRILKQKYLEGTTLNGKKLLPLGMIPIDEGEFSTFRSTYDTVFGELANAAPDGLGRVEFTLDLNRLEDGREIVPGRKLIVNVPKNRTDAELDNILDTIDHQRLQVEEAGWKGKPIPRTEPSAKKYPQEEFTPVPSKENEDREKEKEEKKRIIEIQNKENINRLRNSWWCDRCEQRGNRTPEHKQGCYWGIIKAKDKREKRYAEQAINDLIRENREAREAQEKETEPVKDEVDKVEKVEAKKKARKNKSKTKEATQVSSTGCSENLFTNSVIQDLDREAKESSQNEFVPACKDRRDLGMLEPFEDFELKETYVTKTPKDVKNDVEEVSKTKAVPEPIDEDVDEPMSVQAQVLDELNRVETLAEAIMNSDERANQRNAALEIFEEIRSRVLNDLGEAPQPPIEIIIDEMEQIEELSDQEDDITEEAAVEENVPNAVDEGDNHVQQQNLPPSWCPGGYDENTMEIISCGNDFCASCEH